MKPQTTKEWICRIASLENGKWEWQVNDQRGETETFSSAQFLVLETIRKEGRP